MSMPNIPDINPELNIIRDDAVNIIMASIAMEELALAHILNAEGEKLQYFLGTLEGRDPGEVTICDILSVNNSIHKTLRDVIKQEMLLQLKLEDVIELAENAGECQLSIRGRKTWRDGDNVANTRPASVGINLLRDGELFRTVTVDSTDDWEYIFACLPVWKDSANRYTYQVDEADVPGYTKTVSGYNITNTVEGGSITIDGSIIWDDFNSGDRPASTTVSLLRNGEPAGGPITVVSPIVPENTVPFSFPNVPRFDSEGVPYVYTVDTADIPNYRKTIDSYDITNAIEIRTISGTKTWLNDTGADRPATITVNLLQNNAPTEYTVTVDSPTDPDNVAPFNFPGVPRFDAQGAEFVYTLGEVSVSNYTTSVDNVSYNITNTRNP